MTTQRSSTDLANNLELVRSYHPTSKASVEELRRRVSEIDFKVSSYPDFHTWAQFNARTARWMDALEEAFSALNTVLNNIDQNPSLGDEEPFYDAYDYFLHLLRKSKSVYSMAYFLDAIATTKTIAECIDDAIQQDQTLAFGLDDIRDLASPLSYSGDMEQLNVVGKYVILLSPSPSNMFDSHHWTQRIKHFAYGYIESF